MNKKNILKKNNIFLKNYANAYTSPHNAASKNNIMLNVAILGGSFLNTVGCKILMYHFTAPATYIANKIMAKNTIVNLIKNIFYKLAFRARAIRVAKLNFSVFSFLLMTTTNS